MTREHPTTEEIDAILQHEYGAYGVSLPHWYKTPADLKHDTRGWLPEAVEVAAKARYTSQKMIPDEAVEAALEVSLRQLGLWGKELPQDLVKARRDRITELLEAAAPHLLAEAWLKGYREGELDGAFQRNGHEPPDERNPYRSQT